MVNTAQVATNTTTAVLVIVSNGRDVVIRNNNVLGANHVFVGGANVTAANGFKLDATTARATAFASRPG